MIRADFLIFNNTMVNARACELGVNFSQVLQNALVQELHLADR